MYFAANFCQFSSATLRFLRAPRAPSCRSCGATGPTRPALVHRARRAARCRAPCPSRATDLLCDSCRRSSPSRHRAAGRPYPVGRASSATCASRRSDSREDRPEPVQRQGSERAQRRSIIGVVFEADRRENRSAMAAAARDARYARASCDRCYKGATQRKDAPPRPRASRCLLEIATPGGGQERGCQHRVADVRSRHRRKRRSEPVEAERARDRRLGGQHPLPELRALGVLGRVKHDVAGEPAAQRGIDAGVEVGGEDGHAAEGLDALQEVIDLEACVAIDRGLDLGPLREQRVGLVEQQQGVAGVGGLEDARQLLLGLADPLGDDLRQIDLVEIEDRAPARAGRRPSSCRCRADR